VTLGIEHPVEMRAYVPDLRIVMTVPAGRSFDECVAVFCETSTRQFRAVFGVSDLRCGYRDARPLDSAEEEFEELVRIERDRYQAMVDSGVPMAS